MEAGMIVYAKKLKNKPTRKANELTYKGHAVCLMLGNVRENMAGPSQDQAHQLLGAIGLVSLDLIEETLGKDAQQKIVDAHVAKFNKDVKAVPREPQQTETPEATP